MIQLFLERGTARGPPEELKNVVCNGNKSSAVRPIGRPEIEWRYDLCCLAIFGENLFDDFFTDPFGMMVMPQRHDPLYGKHSKNLMKTDVRETEDSYELDVDLPGFKKDEVNVELKNGYLTIQAAKGLDKDETDKKGKYIRQERYAGSCSRSFYVGEDVEAGEVAARFENGILQLSIPKKEHKQLPKNSTIQIQ